VVVTMSMDVVVVEGRDDHVAKRSTHVPNTNPFSKLTGEILAYIASLSGPRLGALDKESAKRGVGSSFTLIRIALTSVNGMRAALQASEYCLLRSDSMTCPFFNRKRKCGRGGEGDDRKSSSALKIWQTQERNSIFEIQLYARSQQYDISRTDPPLPDHLPKTFAPRRPTRRNLTSRKRVRLSQWTAYPLFRKASIVRTDRHSHAVFDPWTSRSGSHHIKLALMSRYRVWAKVELIAPSVEVFVEKARSRAASIDEALSSSESHEHDNEYSADTSSNARIGEFFKSRKRKQVLREPRGNVDDWIVVAERSRTSLFETCRSPQAMLLMASPILLPLNHEVTMEYEPEQGSFRPVSRDGHMVPIELPPGRGVLLCFRLDPKLRDKHADRHFRIAVTTSTVMSNVERTIANRSTPRISHQSETIVLPSVRSWSTYVNA